MKTLFSESINMVAMASNSNSCHVFIITLSLKEVLLNELETTNFYLDISQQEGAQ